MTPRLWLLDLEALGGVLLAPGVAGAVASDSELSSTVRATASDQARNRLATRIALRLLLRDAGADIPLKAELPLTPEGKPHLAGGEPAFSVSHSGNRAVIVLSACGPVGVDLETERLVDFGQARRALMLAAADVLLGEFAAGVGDNARLLACWTCLEALAKARGCGIGRILTEIGVTAAGVRTHRPEHVAALTRALLAQSGLEPRPLAMPIGLYAAAAAPAGIVPATFAAEDFDIAQCERLIEVLGNATP